MLLSKRCLLANAAPLGRRLPFPPPGETKMMSLEDLRLANERRVRKLEDIKRLRPYLSKLKADKNFIIGMKLAFLSLNASESADSELATQLADILATYGDEAFVLRYLHRAYVRRPNEKRPKAAKNRLKNT
jgi:hypothetical protein